MTSLSSRRGTISSTSVFGVLPSAVTPVAQHWIVVKLVVHAGKEKSHLFYVRDRRELAFLEYVHTLLCHT